jgi:hypothetical protein
MQSRRLFCLTLLGLALFCQTVSSSPITKESSEKVVEKSEKLEESAVPETEAESESASAKESEMEVEAEGSSADGDLKVQTYAYPAMRKKNKNKKKVGTRANGDKLAFQLKVPVNPLTHGKAPALFVASDLDAQVALQVALLEKEEAQDPKDKRVTGFTVLVDPLKNRLPVLRAPVDPNRDLEAAKLEEQKKVQAVGYVPPTEKPRPARPGLPANLAEHILGGKPLKLPEAVASTLQESPLAFKVPVSVAERFPVAPALSSPVDPVKHTLAISTRPVKENFDDADDNGNSDDVYDSEDDDEDSETRSQVARGDCGCECGCACSYEGGCEGGPGYVATTTAIPLKKPIKRLSTFLSPNKPSRPVRISPVAAGLVDEEPAPLRLRVPSKLPVKAPALSVANGVPGGVKVAALQDTIADEDKTPPPRPVLAKNPVLHRPGAAFSIPKNSSDLLVSQLVNETQSLLGSFNTPVAPAKKPPVLRAPTDPVAQAALVAQVAAHNAAQQAELNGGDDSDNANLDEDGYEIRE